MKHNVPVHGQDRRQPNICGRPTDKMAGYKCYEIFATVRIEGDCGAIFGNLSWPF